MHKLSLDKDFPKIVHFLCFTQRGKEDFGFSWQYYSIKSNFIYKALLYTSDKKGFTILKQLKATFKVSL